MIYWIQVPIEPDNLAGKRQFEKQRHRNAGLTSEELHVSVFPSLPVRSSNDLNSVSHGNDNMPYNDPATEI